MLAFCLVFAPVRLFCQPVLLSDDAQISLLTVSEGDALYSAFGHTGVRFRDEKRGLDVVFNYGTFDFNTPGFYLKFLRGQLDYVLAVESFEAFMWTYRDIEKRGVREQVLNLSPEQKKVLFGLIQENYKPGNRYYRYDFFFDNCATKPRDLFERAFGDTFKWGNQPDPQKTFRVLLDEALDDKRWAKFGIDLILGQKTDRIATQREIMFLPEYLRQAVGNASISHQGQKAAFVVYEVVLIPEPVRPSGIDLPTWLAWALFVVILLKMMASFRTQAPMLKWRGVDTVLFLFFGVSGCLIVFLWFFTDHKVTPDNWNLVWLSPTHVLLGVVLTTRPASVFVKRYTQINCLLICTLLLFWGIVPQDFHPAFFPLCLMLLLRSAVLGFDFQKVA
ncbi:MAG TPA: DUF4105 domain-containing protein, partial [Rhodothermales bacterium]|nr:DUF4105 domain-containing protein [Rhodothermales bacterium]